MKRYDPASSPRNNPRVVAPAETEHRAHTEWLVEIMLYNTERPKFVCDGVPVTFRVVLVWDRC
jgi:hypothetical protein